MSLKFIKRSALFFFLLINLVACNHAYRFTHFADSQTSRSAKPEQLSLIDKVSTIATGIKIPKSVNHNEPSLPFETIYLKGDETLEGWLIDLDNSKPMVVMFHGFSSSKSGVLDYAALFWAKGYSTFLVDFRGNGGSDGNQCTVGFKEAEDVRIASRYIHDRFPNKELILFGTSMGAAAVMKSMSQHETDVSKLILECPFGSMRKTTKKRFEAMGVPSFLLADLLLFYGSLQNGFNAFKHRPTEYAKSIETPTLLLYGAKDARVDRSETDEIFKHLKGPKQLGIMANSGHELYLNDDAESWEKAVFDFLGE